MTEYAGPSTIARAQVYMNGQFNLATLRAAMTPPTYVSALTSMGLANDTLMLPLLAKYIPMPDAVKAMGVTDATVLQQHQLLLERSSRSRPTTWRA